MAATLTSAMKDDLATGNAKLLLAAYASGGLTDSTFTGADEIYTMKDSFKITEGDPTSTMIELDQNGGEKVGQVVVSGETTVEATIPFTAVELFDYFYKKATTSAVTLTTGIVSGSTTYKTGTNYSFANKKVVKVKMFVESNSGNTAIVLHNVDLMVTLIQDNVNTTPLGLKLSGKVFEDGAYGAFARLTGAPTV